MKKCSICNEEAYFYDDIDKCPICGETLENYLPPNDEEFNRIKIKLDFSYIECNCGNEYSYSKDVCDKCGHKQEERSDIDPEVKLRKEKFEQVLTLIKDSKVYIKKFKKKSK